MESRTTGPVVGGGVGDGALVTQRLAAGHHGHARFGHAAAAGVGAAGVLGLTAVTPAWTGYLARTLSVD
ncbi:hypothetical protein [Saccharothrix longispora]|uniref:hypothetical protein n=1 Tax=Saccharothrix longispora TaxID=33920 RepID=UPI0028FD6EC2|nr:hypothetical protein [Saccharothrix longispora]MDU0287844.1 hypothetical protein [Saccharothrix longispora]